MSESTNGQLSFGVVFDEGFEFPWDLTHEGDIDEWWRDIRGFVNPIESPFTPEGQYKPGIDRDSPFISEYFAKRREWGEANPLPVDVVNYCSGDYPLHILATKHMIARRGYPERVDADFFEDTDKSANELRAFMSEFGIESDGEIGWWLSSYWG